MSQLNSPNVLPQSVLSHFKSVKKLYEQNQFKRALKQAEQVLRVAPLHGETLSLKALCLNTMPNRKQEAYKCARLALRSDPKNHTCWHVMGLLHRSDRNFFDAGVCFETAHSIEKNDLEIMKDLCAVHIQNRNFDAFFKLSNKIMTLKSSIRGNWGAFAVAAHLTKDYDVALKVLDAYLKSLENADQFTKGEVLFYRSMIIEDSGDIKGALEELEKNKASIVDKEEWKLKKAEYVIKLGRHEEAVPIYKNLIKGNPDNLEFYLGLFKALKLVPENTKSLRANITLDGKIIKELIDLCEESAKENNSKVPLQILLSFVTGKEFKTRFQKYLFPLLTKGVPALFMLVKYLYTDPAKVQSIQEILLEVEENLTKLNKLAPSETEEEPPSTLLWTWYFLAEHYNSLSQTEKALAYAQKCQDHTPTVLDFQLLKAKIFKRAGDTVQAANFTEEARTMDLADRYLNTKATRYFLRADNVTKAESIISIFTKVEQDNNAYRNNIFDMQVVWYEFEEGQSWLRQQNYGMALKRFTDIEKQFSEIHADQFDFHTFCHRKMTLRQYLKMMRFEDKLWGHKFYTRAAEQIVQIYLDLHLHPEIKIPKKSAEEENLTEAERKKLQRKKNREQAKQEEETKTKQENSAQSNKIVDVDPTGEKLVNVLDPLGVANKYLKQLVKYSDSSVRTHILGYQVSLQRKKYLLGLRSILKANSLAPQDPEVHYATVHFFHTLSSVKDLQSDVSTVINLEKQTLLGNRTLQEYNEQFLKNGGDKTVRGRKAYFESSLLLNGEAVKKQLLPILIQTDNTGAHLKESIEVHKLLLKEYSTKEAQEYKTKCSTLFPYSLYFQDKKEVQ